MNAQADSGHIEPTKHLLKSEVLKKMFIENRIKKIEC